MGLFNLLNKAKLASAINKVKNTPNNSNNWKDLFIALWKVKETREMLQRYKTYIMAAALGATAASQYLGFLTPELADTLLKLFGAGGLAALAAKGNRILDNQEK